MLAKRVKEDKLVTPKQIKEAEESCHEHCGWRYLFMAQEKHIEAITEESLSIFIKTRDMHGILTDVVQELSSIHTQLDRLSYEKKSEDRLYE